MVRRRCGGRKKVFCPVDKPYWTTQIYRTFEDFRRPSSTSSGRWPTAANPPLKASGISGPPTATTIIGGPTPTTSWPCISNTASLPTITTSNKLRFSKFVSDFYSSVAGRGSSNTALNEREAGASRFRSFRSSISSRQRSAQWGTTRRSSSRWRPC